jgi:NADH-quinone oxidoreductase subunit E
MASVATDYTNKIVYTDEMAEFSSEVVEEMKSHLVKYPSDRKRSALIPLLFVIQRERGWIDNPGVNFLARFLELEVTDVWETATFYSMFNMRPVGKYHIQVCKTLSCRIMGEPEITGHICGKLGIKPGETTADARPGAPDEFLSKSKWVRFQVSLAGPAMHLIRAVVALAIVLTNGADVPKYQSEPPIIGEYPKESTDYGAGTRLVFELAERDGFGVVWEVGVDYWTNAKDRLGADANAVQASVALRLAYAWRR